jgi:hypothetical protein
MATVGGQTLPVMNILICHHAKPCIPLGYNPENKVSIPKVLGGKKK